MVRRAVISSSPHGGSRNACRDVPISITVYNQQQLANRNVVSGNDLATYTPSLSANSRFGAETAAFAIRGFTQENFTSPSVATYFADVIGPRANGGTTGGNGAGVGQFFDLQNVQVLKGPQGTLFGRNTTGGAVLIVPQRPKDEWGGYLEGSYGNFDMYRVQGVLNLPLADTFKVRLGFERQNRDGFVRNRSGIGPRDYDDVNYWAFRGSVLAELTPDLENYIIARYSRSRTNGTYGKLVGANAPGCDVGVDRSVYPYPGSPNLTLPGATPATHAVVPGPARLLGHDRTVEGAQLRVPRCREQQPRSVPPHQAVGRHQHHDLARERHDHAEEHRQLPGVPAVTEPEHRQ